MPGLEITAVHIKILQQPASGSPLMAFAKITLNEVFVVAGIRIVNGKGGLFISFPRELTHQKKPIDVCFPIRRETHDMMTERILGEYQKAVAA